MANHITLCFISLLTCTAPVLSQAIEKSVEREVIVFNKDLDLWVMDPKTRAVQRWTQDGVGDYSVSRNGRITYDRVYPEQIKDANIYFSESPGAKARKLTDDNQSIHPMISPDGSKIVYQKIDLTDPTDNTSALRETAKGLWLYDVDRATHRKIAGAIAIPPKIKREWQLQSPKAPEPSDDKWQTDHFFIWSTDSKRLLFARIFDQGALEFWINLAQEPPTINILDTEGSLTPVAFGKTEIIFIDYKNNSLVAMQPESGIRRRLAKGLDVQGVALSPDEQSLACIRIADQEKLSIWLIDYSGEGRREVTESTFEGIDDIELDWSRDGSAVVTTDFSEDPCLALLISVKGRKRLTLGSPICNPIFTAITQSAP